MKKTKLNWESKKFDRTNLKSKYSTSSALEEMKDLILKTKDKFQKVIVSYNNTYNANSQASNNKISFEEMKNILKIFGKLQIIEINHKHFNSGKTHFLNHN